MAAPPSWLMAQSYTAEGHHGGSGGSGKVMEGTGEEYAKMPFQVLLDRLQEAVRSGPRVVVEFLAPDGSQRTFSDEDG